VTRPHLDDIDRVLVAYVAKNQPTTLPEIGEVIDRCKSVTWGRVRRLVAAGVLRHEPRIPRTIRLHPSVVVTDRGVYQLEKMP
jgi:DNA-binding Lrp family transcriptional regulator